MDATRARHHTQRAQRVPAAVSHAVRTCATAALTLVAGLCAATDINQANEAELDSVRGFGPPTTARILQERAKAPFASWADFMHRVKGIKQARARQLSNEGLTVNGQAYPGP
jgi:competence protein ComEA